MVDTQPIASCGDCASQLLMPTGEDGAEIRPQLLSDLRQRALVGANMFGQATLRCVAAKQRSCSALRGQLLEFVVADGAGVRR
jgi:hypothetical protein